MNPSSVAKASLAQDLVQVIVIHYSDLYSGVCVVETHVLYKATVASLGYFCLFHRANYKKTGQKESSLSHCLYDVIGSKSVGSTSTFLQENYIVHLSMFI